MFSNYELWKKIKFNIVQEIESHCQLIRSLYIATTPRNAGFSKHLRFFSLHTMIVI